MVGRLLSERLLLEGTLKKTMTTMEMEMERFFPAQ